MAGAISESLAKEGYEMEIKTVYRGAFQCYIRFPGLLYQEGLSGFTEEKILIQMDTEPEHFPFQPERCLLNRFDVFTEIFYDAQRHFTGGEILYHIEPGAQRGARFF